MNAKLRWVVIGLLFLALGCVSAPRATVELAEITDQQIAEMQASHEKFVRLYYDKLRDDVDHFMEQRWIPQFLSNVVEGRGEGGKSSERTSIRPTSLSRSTGKLPFRLKTSKTRMSRKRSVMRSRSWRRKRMRCLAWFCSTFPKRHRRRSITSANCL